MKTSLFAIFITLSLNAVSARADYLVEHRLEGDRRKLSTQIDDLDTMWRDGNITSGAQQITLSKLEYNSNPKADVSKKDLVAHAVDSLQGNFHQLTSDEIDPSSLAVKTQVRAAEENTDLLLFGKAVSMAMDSLADDSSAVQLAASLVPVVSEMNLNDTNAILVKACTTWENMEILQILLMNTESHEMLSLYAQQGDMDGTDDHPNLCADVR
jgi:hypothetical protein